MNKKIFNTNCKNILVFNSILILGITLLISLLIFSNGDVQLATLSQSMLLVCGFSSLSASLFLEVKKEKWLASIYTEIKNAFAIMVLNLLIAWLVFFLFSLIPSPSQNLFVDAIHNPNTYFFLSAGFLFYLFFRLFFRLWLLIDHLRKQYFAWSLTYYFLFIEVVAVFIIFVISTIMFSAAMNRFVGGISMNRWSQIFDWLVNTILPMIGFFVVFLFFSLVFLIPPFTLFALIFAKRITNRLRNLGETAAELRKGNFKARSPVQGSDEIAQLQLDFNSMAENLEKAIDELDNEKDVVNGLLEERKQLVARVSHELKTPITTIMNYQDVIREQVKKKRDKELKKNIEIISQEVNHLDIIINDLFDLSRAEIGRLAIKKEPCDIAEIIEQVIEAQKPIAWQTRHVELASQIEKKLPKIKLDKSRINQILNNLIRNSVQHTPPGGIIQVCANKHEQSLFVTVKDTGEGIPSEELPEIWTKFHKDLNSITGSGIGLSVVKELVDLMDGKIIVRSKVGVGSEFQIEFPIK